MVQVPGRLLFNCCKAYPERINLDWLEKNPGKLFHTDTMVKDRLLMLEDKPCDSCYHGCYKQENKGLISTRQIPKNNNAYIEDAHSPMVNLQISLSTDCNLSCVYCSPEYSTAWQREVANGGEYSIGDHNIASDNWTTLWSKMKQKSRSTQSKFFELLLKEIELAKGLKRISLLGGEPLLNSELTRIIDRAHDKSVQVVTGLGVSDTRLLQLLDKVKGLNVHFSVSAESTNENFEFVRHGISWTDIVRRVQIIKEHGFKVDFISTISNLSIFDFANFCQYAGQTPIGLNHVQTPHFLSPHVLDDKSKQKFLQKLDIIGEHASAVVKMVEKDASDYDRKNIGIYLQQLSHRRSKSLSFLPKHFLKWCGVNALD